MAEEKKISINNKEIVLSKPDKELFPEAGITKSGVNDYYRKIWKYVKPYAEDRPMVLQRFPDGIDEEGFFQKKVPVYFPEWIDTIEVDVKKENAKEDYVNCNSEETIVYLSNQACLTMHVWLSKKKDLDKPDRMAFDFDPADDDFEKVRKAALTLKELLNSGNIPCFPMTTGSRGLHVIIPLKAENDFDEVRELASQIAEKVAEKDKKTFTTETSKKKRKNRVFIDYLRNAYGQTTVLPYSLRALAEAPVAVPLGWDEVNDKDLQPRKYNIKNVFRRLSQKQDPWKDMYKDVPGLDDIRESIIKNNNHA